MGQKKLSAYALSKKSGVSYTVMKDIVSGRKKIENLSGKTILSLAKALDCKMEDIMMLETEYVSYRESGLSKDQYFETMLRDRKNTILNKRSALMYHRLANIASDSKISVFACTDLPIPFSVTKVENFDGIEYVRENGMMITTVNQTINDMVADEENDPQPLLEALSNYYFSHNETFDGLNISEENLSRFQELCEESMQYYCED